MVFKQFVFSYADESDAFEALNTLADLSLTMPETYFDDGMVLLASSVVKLCYLLQQFLLIAFNCSRTEFFHQGSDTK